MKTLLFRKLATQRLPEKVILCILVATISACHEADGSSPTPNSLPVNSPPVIESISISPQPVITEATLIGHVVGADDDTFSYRWSIGGIGGIAVGNYALWRSPGIPGTYTVKLEVQGTSTVASTAETVMTVGSGSPWPKVRGDIQGTGRSRVVSSPTGALGWIASFHGGMRADPVIAADGTIYIVVGNVHAMNPNGTLRWIYSFPDGSWATSSPTVAADGTVYVGTGGGSRGGSLFAINPDGTLRWQYVTDYAIGGSPALAADGTIYIGNWNNNLYAVNPDGTLKWFYAAGSGIRTSPVQSPDGTLYIASKDDGTLHAVRPDGTLLWRFLTGGFIGAAAAVGSDGTIYIGSSDRCLYAIGPDGVLKWKFLTGGTLSSPTIANDGTVYVGSDDHSLYALAPDGGLKWGRDLGSHPLTPPVIGGDGVIYISIDRKMYAINPDSSVKWVYSMPGNYWISSSIAIGWDGTLYVSAENITGNSQLHAIK